MKASEYMSQVSRLGKKLEKELCEDFKSDPAKLSEVLAELERSMLQVQNVIISAFMSK